MNEKTASRKKALEDGKQKDITEIAKECGLYFPVFMTDSVWNDWIVPDPKSIDSGEDEKQRLKKVIDNLVYALRMHRQSSKLNIIYFNVSLNQNGENEDVQLVSLLSPLDIDDKRPAITIMLADEHGDRKDQ